MFKLKHVLTFASERYNFPFRFILKGAKICCNAYNKSKVV